jgi:hypothetical protein
MRCASVIEASVRATQAGADVEVGVDRGVETGVAVGRTVAEGSADDEAKGEAVASAAWLSAGDALGSGGGLVAHPATRATAMARTSQRGED